MKYLSNFKKIVNICIKNGWLDRDPFFGYKMTKREIERPFLTDDELNKLSAKTFLIDRVKHVRDIFIFCCYTGLAYVDVLQLTRSEIATGIKKDHPKVVLEKPFFNRRLSLGDRLKIALMRIPSFLPTGCDSNCSIMPLTCSIEHPLIR